MQKNEIFLFELPGSGKKPLGCGHTGGEPVSKLAGVETVMVVDVVGVPDTGNDIYYSINQRIAFLLLQAAMASLTQYKRNGSNTDPDGHH